MYDVHLLDRDDCHLVNHHEDTLGAARARARYLMTDDFAMACGSTHDRLGTARVVVLRDGGVELELVRR